MFIDKKGLDVAVRTNYEKINPKTIIVCQFPSFRYACFRQAYQFELKEQDEGYEKQKKKQRQNIQTFKKKIMISKISVIPLYYINFSVIPLYYNYSNPTV